MTKKLYVYTIELNGGLNISRLREAIASLAGIRLQSFIKSQNVFVIHSEINLSQILREAGFSFREDTYDIEEGPSI